VALGSWAFRRPLVLTDLLRVIVFRSGGTKKALKNLMVLPKATHVARELERRRVEHVHAHWATTPATMAFIASRLAGMPWSFTAHQWDITDRNLLADKVAAASFARVISEDGRREFAGYLSPTVAAAKLQTIYMGVTVPDVDLNLHGPPPDTPRIVIPARLHEKKGHAYVFEALTILRDVYHRPVRCLVVGDGPLRDRLTALRQDLGLTEQVEFVGQLPHEELIALYARGGIEAVVHPSVVAMDGEREGIPVALMEAMAFGIPVVTTPNGGITELVDGAGLLVPERDASALADAIASLFANESFAREIAAAGRRRIADRFSTGVVVQQLERLWRQSSRPNGGEGPKA
jgi:colanic acid/amylovoran biosynthesis glycosyltransferase